MRRLLAILAVAALAAPGLWWRAPAPPPPDWRQRIEFVPLPLGQRRAGVLAVLGAWQLRSRFPAFGSFSAMVSPGPGRLLAVSDAGRMAAFAMPGAPPQPVELGPFAGRRVESKYDVDIEGMTRDPATGRIWVSYEGSNSIERFAADFSGAKRVAPLAMRDWPGNTGPETLVRLADGRFIVISEARSEWLGGYHEALLFASDPVAGAQPREFLFDAPDGFRPVDAAALPDGRVLILLRRVDWLPPGFANRLVVADPAAIRPGMVWRSRPLANVGAPLPSDNYEGLTMVDRGHGVVDIWLISDDNFNPYQRTLLLHLQWPDAYEKARGVAAGRSDSR